MTDEIIFYTNPMSRGRIVRWMLEEVGQPYETVLLDYATTIKGADYLAINPMGKVPAIRHGETVVTEAAAICAYLADAFPDSTVFVPPNADATILPYFDKSIDLIAVPGDSPAMIAEARRVATQAVLLIEYASEGEVITHASLPDST